MNELRLFDAFGLDALNDPLRELMRPWRSTSSDLTPQIRVDLTEQDGSYLVEAAIPGVRKEDIDVRIDGGQVTISAETAREEESKEGGGRVVWKERQEGYASRSFTLACPVDEGLANATYQDGVLALRLPKKAANSAKKLTIQ